MGIVRGDKVTVLHFRCGLSTLTPFPSAAQHLRQVGVVGKFVEFFGPGVAQLSIADRATIANMCPEYGATAAFFPVDEVSIKYLVQTGECDTLRSRALWNVSQSTASGTACCFQPVQGSGSDLQTSSFSLQVTVTAGIPADAKRIGHSHQEELGFSGSLGLRPWEVRLGGGQAGTRSTLAWRPQGLVRILFHTF